MQRRLTDRLNAVQVPWHHFEDVHSPVSLIIDVIAEYSHMVKNNVCRP
jgi:hypothetical protein